MAPRSQEPQERILEETNKYIATITFTVDSKDKGTICYIFEGNKNSISQKATEQFRKDFPIDGIGITVSVAEIKDENFQKATDKKKILKLMERYLNYQYSRGDNKKIKFKGELTPINEIKRYYGFTEEEKTLEKEEKPSIIVPQMPKQSKETVLRKKGTKSWFCEYNIKIGTEKFRKGTIIDNADNEVDARKQLDIYIKRTFTKIRSVTKVTIKEWNGECEFSDQIIEKKAPIKEKVEPVINRRSLNEVINEEFSEEDLNERVLLIVVKHGKIKPKDFENDFFVKEDEGQTDEELYQEMKKDCPSLRKKHLAVRRATFKQVLTTNRYKQILTSSAFEELVKDGFDGIDALTQLLDKQIKKLKEGTISDKLLDNLIDKLWTGISA